MYHEQRGLTARRLAERGDQGEVGLRRAVGPDDDAVPLCPIAADHDNRARCPSRHRDTDRSKQQTGEAAEPTMTDDQHPRVSRRLDQFRGSRTGGQGRRDRRTRRCCPRQLRRLREHPLRLGAQAGSGRRAGWRAELDVVERPHPGVQDMERYVEVARLVGGPAHRGVAPLRAVDADQNRALVRNRVRDVGHDFLHTTLDSGRLRFRA
jgi:hypothetical protein